MENIVAVAVRDWIGVMNSEKKYRNKKKSGGIDADSQRHYGGLAELPTDKKASENFHRPAYQACELIRKSSELFSESSEE